MPKIEEIDLSLISNYSTETYNSVCSLIENNMLEKYLLDRYPNYHSISNNKELLLYAKQLKNRYLKKSQPLHKVSYDDSIDRVYKALGLNSSKSFSHGRKTKSVIEIRISSIFKKCPDEFLKMIVVHELAHLKEKNHDKKFYSLCQNMESNYFQLEFDFRLYLIQLEME
ncbi:M48 family peptidase [Thiospirochaeta perfilievii]|uniref:M48 family peptidase n=1 Tax=Thiospirochaeta perfilievii TaxID=252967 RepID=A0A5C1Q550_9SPIO|nr:SprT-like domain-containing protein [Thiospirochaeta perfilievii]QEN03155.1 M48 family peptidase [Thiospirochaeta perfilievii]